MITIDEARERARTHVAPSETTSGPLVIIDEATIVKPYGWVFFYQSKRFIESNDHKHALAGNAPILVLKDSGEVVPLGTAKSAEEYLLEYERRGPRGK